MAIPNRPGRPSTRPGQPAVKVPAKSGSAPRPSTGPVAKQSAPATRGRAPRPTQTPAAKSNTPMILGIVAGLVAILGIAAFALSGNSSEKPASTGPRESSKPKVVDVSSLERDGMTKCNEGLAIIKKNETLLGSHSLSDGQKTSLRAELEKGKKCIVEGMGLLTQANEKSGNRYDTTQYQEALITVRKKLMELRD